MGESTWQNVGELGVNTSLVVNVSDPEVSGDRYRVIASNVEGTAVSQPAAIIIDPALVQFPTLESNTTAFGWYSQFQSPQIGGAGTVNPSESGIVSVAAGRTHIMWLTANGTVHGAGGTFGGSIPVPLNVQTPNPSDPIIQMATSYGTYVRRKGGSTLDSWKTVPGSPEVLALLHGCTVVRDGQFLLVGARPDGTVVQVGMFANTGNTAQPPEDLNRVIDVAGGSDHGLALKSDGTVAAWGLSPQATVPPDLQNVVAISTTFRHNLALKTNGTVVQWGAELKAMPPGLGNVVAVAAGVGHSLALKSDGTVVGWGNNDVNCISGPMSKSNVIAISARTYSSAVLQKNTWDVPVFVSQPPSRKIGNLERALLYAAVVGPGEISFQWYKDTLDNPIPGATSSSYLTPPLTAPANYFVRATNAFGSVTSLPVTIAAEAAVATAPAPPIITTQPQSGSVGFNTSANLSAYATGAGVSYQWYRGERTDFTQPLGSNSNTLTTPPLLETSQFWVQASNAGGSRYSLAANITIIPTPFSIYAGGLGLSGGNLAPDAAPFADGLPNLLRYALNLGATPDPGRLPAASIEMVDGVPYMKFQFRRRKTLPGVALVTQYSTDLGTWEDIPQENLTQLADDDADTERWQARLPLPPDGRLFLRLRATEQ